MPIEKFHPELIEVTGQIEQCRDSYEGSEKIKKEGTKYLPATQSQIRNGQGGGSERVGEKAYQAYKKRAVYPDLYEEAVNATIGIMFKKPPTFELPKQLEPLLTKATPDGDTLEGLLRKINTIQWTTGRAGLMGDIRPDMDNKAEPILLLYPDLTAFNWATTKEGSLLFVALNESGYVLDGDFDWVWKDKYLALALVDDNKISENGTYQFANLDKGQELASAQFETPSLQGQDLNEIPFSFINATDLSTTPSKPPLLGLSEHLLTIYRGEADYRQNLFMQGQDTLVTLGANIDKEDDVPVGAGARLDLPINGDAKYIGVSSTGLSEQRTALENDYAGAHQRAGQYLSDAGSNESGEALKIRVSAKTATLPTVAKVGAAGLEKVLRILAVWYGANPDEVVVKPNLEFSEADLNGQTLVQMLQAKGLGAPLSNESIHKYLQDKGITTMSYEDEIARTELEKPTL